jgi:hypothetical protein
MKKTLFLSALFLAFMLAAAPQNLKAAHSMEGLKESQAPRSTDPISGKVLETMGNGGYTYVNLQKENGDKVWVAVMDTPVVVGSQMSFKPGIVMSNFESKGLNRTFESVVFSDGPLTAPVTVTTPDLKKGQATSPGSKGATVVKEEKISVEKATGANAITVGEAYKNSAALDKKKVVVRGKVVKVSTGIMKKNWIHIQDGTGSQKQGTHSLVCTSQDTAEVGDVVTVSGILAKDRDFGSGYRYKVIIESAKVKK